MDFFARMEELISSGGFRSRAQFCALTGLSRRAYLDLSRGAHPRNETINKVASATGLSAYWLRTGRGPKLAEDFNRMIEEWEKEHGE